jgi:hypothetical protein
MASHPSGRDGKVLDVVNKHKPSAMDSAIVTSHDRDVWLGGTNEVFGTFADEAIHVRPKKLDPAAEVRMHSILIVYSSEVATEFI